MRRLTLAILIATLLMIPCAALAASGAGGINMVFNTSARFEALGSAGAGAPWGTDTNHWANPALLAFRPGVHYLKFESQLALGLADDIYLTNEEITVGAWGVTLLWAREPVNGNYLDLGQQQGTDESGNPTDAFHSYMEAKSWGLGLDAVVLVESLIGRTDQPYSRYVSIAGGYVWTDFKDKLAPDEAIQDSGGGTAESKNSDKGFVIRATPINFTTNGGLLDNGVIGLRLGGAYGWSLLNDADEFIRHADADQSDPHPRTYLTGWSFNGTVPIADGFRQSIGNKYLRLLVDVVNPLFSFTYTDQKNQPGYVWNPDLGRHEYGRDTSGRYDETGFGREFCFGNLYYHREGRVSAPYGAVDGPTSGHGWSIQLGGLAGWRKDWATVPQAQGLPEVHRKGWSWWVDPVAIYRFLQE